MDLNAEKQQIERIKRAWARWAGDPDQLRFLVVLVLSVVGIFAVERPMASALALARIRNADAAKTAHLAEELVRLSDQVATYTPRASVEADLVAWQNYVLDKLRCTNATLIALEPHKTIPKGPFEIVEMEVVAKGSVYSAFVDFIDRVEHGERLVRIDKLRFERQQTSMYMTAIIRGLCKGGAPVKSSSKTLAAAPGAAAQPGTVTEADIAGPPAELAGPAPDADLAATPSDVPAAETEDAAAAAAPALEASPAPDAEPVPQATPAPEAGGDSDAYALKKHIVMIALLLISWFGYSDLSAEGPEKVAEAKTEIAEITPEMLAVHETSSVSATLDDPFRFTKDGVPIVRVVVQKKGATPGTDPKVAAAAKVAAGSAAGSAGSGAASVALAASGPAPATLAAADDAVPAPTGWLASVKSTGAWVATLGRQWYLKKAADWMASHPHFGEPPPPPAHFVLVLESTLALPGGGQARLCGRSVAVGESLPELDPLDPPVLLAVAGSSVVVSHGEARYVLDLNGATRLEVGVPPVAVPAAAASPLVAAGPAPAAAASAAAPAVNAPAPGTDSAGRKKGAYRSRSLPKKGHP